MVVAPEFTAVILAGTNGARWFPMTSNSRPKHLQPIVGIPIMVRQLQSLAAIGFKECVIAVAKEDKVTVDVLKELDAIESSKSSSCTFQYDKKLRVVLHHLPDDCAGSLHALKIIEEASLIPSSCHVLVLPGDLVIVHNSALSALVHNHRTGVAHDNAACTMLLADVGEQDENGVPLKESAKAKKNVLSREDDQIEYIALAMSSSTTTATTTTTPRVVWKQSKIDVEEDLDMVGTSPKLVLPKPRLCHGQTTRVRTDWLDIHGYVLSPWVRQIAIARPSLVSIQGDLLPLLVERQFQGIKSTFGTKDEAKAIFNASFQSATSTGEEEQVINDKADMNYSVRASLLNGSSVLLRANTLPAYLIASRELVTRAIAEQEEEGTTSRLVLPPDSKLNPKYSSLIMSNVDLGDKVQIKSSVVGSGTKLGTRSKLNNVVVMQNVKVGDNVVLQNAVLGEGCEIGDNCSLSNVRITHGQVIASGTKEKGDYSMDEI